VIVWVGVPTADRIPFTVNLALDWNCTVTPGSIMRDLPNGTVTPSWHTSYGLLIVVHVVSLLNVLQTGVTVVAA
jgi:hypothetical protein